MSKRILVVGSGFGGMWSAIAARRIITQSPKAASVGADIEVALIAPEERLVIRPRLYEPNPDRMSAPLGDVFRATGVRFIKGSVDTIRTSAHEVDMVDPAGVRSTISYDKLVLAAGSKLVRPPIPGLEEHAFSVDCIEDATALEAHLKKLPSLPDSPERNTVVVCGAGFTGLEAVTALPNRLRAIFGNDAKFRIVLIGNGPEVGSDMGPNPRPAIVKALQELGVETKLGSGVTSIDAGGVVTADGSRTKTLTAIWTAGVKASPLTQQIAGDKDHAGRLRVDKDLRVPGVPDVFATGDSCVAATDDEGNFSTMSCQHAQPMGRYAGHNAAADLLGEPLIPYSQPEYGICLDLGENNAVVTRGWKREPILTEGKAKEMKTFINTTLIYPPEADAEKAFAAADPLGEPPVL